MKRALIFSPCLLAVVVLAVVLSIGLLAAPAAAQLQILTADDEGDDDDDGPFGNTPCNCYHDYDCPELQGCNVGTPMCLIEGKLDGLCEDWQSPSGFEGGDQGSEGVTGSVLDAIHRYFDLYAPIITAGGSGKPGEDQAADLGELTGQGDTAGPRPSDDEGPCIIVVARIYLIDVLNNAMERSFGYDFNISPLQQFGNLRHVPDVKAAAALLEATRAAFKTSIRQRDPKAVRGPLERFWKRYPDYHPRHSGRCYPHGHENERSPQECQAIAFSRMSAGILASLGKSAGR